MNLAPAFVDSAVIQAEKIALVEGYDTIMGLLERISEVNLADFHLRLRGGERLAMIEYNRVGALMVIIPEDTRPYVISVFRK